MLVLLPTPVLLVRPFMAAAAACTASLWPLTARLGVGSMLTLLPVIDVLGLVFDALADGLPSTSASAPASTSSSRCDKVVLVLRLWFVIVTVDDVDAVEGA
jgi:hypothetical protein